MYCTNVTQISQIYMMIAFIYHPEVKVITYGVAVRADFSNKPIHVQITQFLNSFRHNI